MDIKKSPKQRNNPIIIVAVTALVLVLAIYLYNDEGHDVSLSSVEIADVQKGNFDVSINAFGQLESKYKQLLTAQSAATVQELLVKPGGIVEKGTPIVVLSNPELMQELEQAQLQLLQQEAVLQQTKINQKIQRLDQRSRLAELESQFVVAKMRLESESSLSDVGIISRIDFQASKVNIEQLKLMIDVQKERISQVADLQKEEVKIAEKLIEQQKSVVRSIEKRVDSLSVKANFNGVVQRVFVEVGQSVATGTQIAEVGSSNELVAHLRVPQSQAPMLQTGQKASIFLNGKKALGSIVRIEPVVVNNNITVEVEFEDESIEGARAQQNVQSHINIASIKDALYIETPTNAQPNSSVTLYKMSQDNRKGEAKTLQLGAQSGKYTQVLAGAKLGEKYIINNLKTLSEQKQEINLAD
ncbi:MULTISPECIES: efflux RND transporter periplasmic adaptor subunit [Pseudoalteromonas]|uniref:RND transporter n=1 Tax=Pseudoalteromonas amylolytica TaxID=1859457 RepID=A0A1S1MUI5_9GAMM|nr:MULTISPECIES: HlyD family efflux transporter periplasmic adaptor subunit [Pseudoalteromonas]OHU84899.1 hypothetical protein BFC16_19605 [Pseudoalteromonas sp. JW3]OHU90150.1 hypothetical protein BET10_15370 [Pseudoalteromonas amylolytica]